MNQKGFANTILITVVIILVAIGGYFVMAKKSTPIVKIQQEATTIPGIISDTLNWKTYTNEQYGFEFKYPENYSVSVNPTDSNVTFKSEGCKSLVSGGGEWPTDCQSYNVLVQQNKISGPEMSKTFVAGIQAEKYSDSNGMWSNGTQVLVQFQKGQNWFIHTFTFNSGRTQESESLMNQILSTFKFVVKSYDQTISQCLPSDIKLDTVIDVNQGTIRQKLYTIKAKCENGKLVDSSNKEIYFYHLTGCWGNPPVNYQDILEKQTDEINKLKEMYNVIEMSCNPLGVLIQ